MPVLAVLASTTQVGQREHAALLQEQHAARAEARREADVESAVGVEQGGVLAIALHALLAHDEHRDLRTVLAGIEHLFRDELRGIELQLRTEPHFALPGGVVVLVDAAGVGEAGEAVKAEGVVALAAEAARAADVGERDLLPFAAIEPHAVEAAGGVLQVFCEEVAATGADALQKLFRFGDDVLPIRLRGIRGVHLHQTIVRCIHFRHHQEFARSRNEVNDAGLVVEAGLQGCPLS